MADSLEREQYDLFISYSSKRSDRHALALRDALYGLDKRQGAGPASIRIFLDRISLRAGTLGSNIKEALETSRCLVVLLDEVTVDSTWVDQEIRQWLDGGGSADRLFLIRTSAQIDLSWDYAKQNFSHSEQLPPALSGVYPDEQKWIEFTVPPRRVGEIDLIGLYSSVMAVDPEQLGEDERRHLQKQRRRSRIFSSALTILLLVAMVAAGVAVDSSRRATSSAQQSEADALAAEALLTLPVAQDKAVNAAVAASRLGSGSSIRSALLATAAETSALRGTFDAVTDGGMYRLDGVSLDASGNSLTAWGPSSEGPGTAVVSWILVSGDVAQNFVVSSEEITSMVEVPGVGYLACTESQIIQVGWLDHRAEVVRSDVTQCATDSMATAGLATGATSGDNPLDPPREFVIALTVDNEFVSLDGTLLQGPRNAANRVVLDGGGALSVLHPGGATAPFEDAWMINYTPELVLVGDEQGYSAITLHGSEIGHQRLEFPEEAIEVAAAVLYDDELAAVWLTKDGTVGSSVTGTPLKLIPDEVSTTAGDDGPVPSMSLTPIARSSFLAVVGTTPFLIDLFGDSVTARRLERIRNVGQAGDFLNVTSCGTGVAVLSTGHVVSRDGSVTATEAELVGCRAVSWGAPLMVDGKIVLESSSTVPRLTALSGDGDLIIGREGGSVSVYAVEDSSAPWQKSAYTDVISGGFGRSILSGNGSLSIFHDAKSVRLGLGASGRWVRARPDGNGGIFVNSTGLWSVHGDDVPLMVSPKCSIGSLYFEPSTGFENDSTAAETPLLVGVSESSERLNCLTGEALPKGPAVLAYEIGPDLGTVVTEHDGLVRVTTWNPSPQGSAPRTTSLPGTFAGFDKATVAPSGTHLAIIADDSHEALGFRDDGRGWVLTQRFALATEGGFLGLTQDGAFLVTATDQGMFEIFDTITGRRLAHDTTALDRDQEVHYLSMSLSTIEGDLVIYFAGEDSGGSIRVPVSEENLRTLLCGVHHAPQC